MSTFLSLVVFTVTPTHSGCFWQTFFQGLSDWACIWFLHPLSKSDRISWTCIDSGIPCGNQECSPAVTDKPKINTICKQKISANLNYAPVYLLVWKEKFQIFFLKQPLSLFSEHSLIRFISSSSHTMWHNVYPSPSHLNNLWSFEITCLTFPDLFHKVNICEQESCHHQSDYLFVQLGSIQCVILKCLKSIMTNKISYSRLILE